MSDYDVIIIGAATVSLAARKVYRNGEVPLGLESMVVAILDGAVRCEGFTRNGKGANETTDSQLQSDFVAF